MKKYIVLAAILLHSITFSQETITVTGVGDMMFGTDIPSDKYMPAGDGKHLLADVRDILRDSDVTFGNLEGCLLDSLPVDWKETKKYYFKMKESFVDILTDAGFDVVSIANNHIGDFGKEGLAKTVEVLENAKINFSGLNKYPYTIFTMDSVRYGFAAFAFNWGTPLITNLKKAKEIVTHLEENSDIVIVSFHGGGEGKEYRNVTRETEFFLEGNRGNVYEFAHTVVDAGADIVFGHGPHVTRGLELYKDRFIAYSLGNFMTYGRFNLNGHNGLAPIIKVHVNRSGEFEHAEVTSVKQCYYCKTRIDKNNGALKDILELTASDFPETNLYIGQDGIITRKIKVTENTEAVSNPD